MLINQKGEKVTVGGFKIRRAYLQCSLSSLACFLTRRIFVYRITKHQWSDVCVMLLKYSGQKFFSVFNIHKFFIIFIILLSFHLNQKYGWALDDDRWHLKHFKAGKNIYSHDYLQLLLLEEQTNKHTSIRLLFLVDFGNIILFLVSFTFYCPWRYFRMKKILPQSLFLPFARFIWKIAHEKNEKRKIYKMWRKRLLKRQKEILLSTQRRKT